MQRLLKTLFWCSFSDDSVSSPTARMLVQIGMILQFHVAAAVHIVGIVYFVIEAMQFEPTPSRHDMNLWPALAVGFSISLAVLIVVYAIFRVLLAKATFGQALFGMIVFNVLHSVGWLIFSNPITVVRLAIPTLLFFIAAVQSPSTASEQGKAAEPADAAPTG